MGLRSLGVAAACLLFLPAAAPAATWSIAGEELRQRHADTLEDLLREVPFLRVDRFGAGGLPYGIGLDSRRRERILLVVDGLPWADPLSGENLYEELPLALLERVEVELEPSLLDYGPAALAGVVRVWTRRNADPMVDTRIHLSRGSFAERSRRLSFETPPGDHGVALGLDEFFGDGYLFGDVWGGPRAASPAVPEVSYSRRRVLALRLDFDAGLLGPLAAELVQSSWHMNLEEPISRGWYRDLYQVSLDFPSTPWGRLLLAQRGLDRRGLASRAFDSSLLLRWEGPALPIPGGHLDLAGGAERHQLALRLLNEQRPAPRPSILWLSAQWRQEAAAALDLSAGGRLEGEWRRPPRLLYQAKVAWPREARPAQLALFAAGGDCPAPWRYDRIGDFGLWPAGVSAADSAAPESTPLRTGVRLDGRIRGLSLDLELWHETGGIDWEPLSLSESSWQWRGRRAPDRNAAAIALGSLWDGETGRAETRLSLVADLEGARTGSAFPAGYPLLGRAELHLGRPFFQSDARLTVGGILELRDGFADREPLLVLGFEAELRVLQARFWLRLANALDWGGEEIPGFPVPPSSLRLGLDWHLAH